MGAVFGPMPAIDGGEKVEAMLAKVRGGMQEIGSAFQEAGQHILDFGTDYQKALNQFQVETGAAAEQMTLFGGVIQDVYSANYGESIGDVADALAEVQQSLGGDWSADALQSATEGALLLRDSFGIELSDSIGAAKTLMGELGIDADTAFALLAQGAQKGIGSLTELGPEALAQLTALRDGCGETAGVVESLNGIRFNDLDSAMQGLGRMVQTDVMLPIAEGLLPTLTDMANRLKDAFQSEEMQASLGSITGALADLGEKFVGFAESQLPKLIEGFAWILEHGGEIAAGIAAFAAAFATIQIGALIASLSGGMALFAGIGPALGAALAAIGGPITLIIAGVAALVAGVVALWNNCEWFREGVIAAWTAIQGCISMVVTALVNFFTVTIPEAWNMVLQFFQNIPVFFSELWATITQVLSDGWMAVVAFFTETIPAFLASIMEWFNQLPYQLGALLGLLVQSFLNWGASIQNWVTSTLPSIIEGIISWFGQLPGRIWTWLSDVVQKIIAWGGQLIANAQTAASNTVGAVVNFFAGLPGLVWSWLSQTVAKVVAWGAQMVSTAGSKMTEFGQNIITSLQQLPGKMLEIGGNIITGIWDGINNMAGWIKGKISEWCGSFVQGFKDFLGIQSPSTEFRDQVGKNIVLGIDEGISENAKTVIKTAGELSQHILSEATKWVDGKKFYNDLALEDELAFWEDLRSMKGLQEGEQAEIDKKIFTAKQSLLKAQQDAELAAQQEQQKALDAYDRNVQSRVDALSRFAGLFDEVKVKSDVSGQELIDNLKGQVAAFQSWQADMDTLTAKGVTGPLLEELERLGPSAADKIHALSVMSEEKLDEYAALFAEKSAMIQAQAKLDVPLPGELGGMTSGMTNPDSESELEKMGVAAGNLMTAFQTGIRAKDEELLQTGMLTTDVLSQGMQLNDPLLQERTTLLMQNSMLTLQSFVEPFRQAGYFLMQGVAQGVMDGRSGLINTIIWTLEAAVWAAREAMDINSPSKVWAKIGSYMAQGLGSGFTSTMQSVSRQISDSIPTPSIETSGMARIGEGIVNGVAQAAQFSAEVSAPIVLEVNLDSKQIARQTFEPLQAVARQRGVAFG